MKSPFGNMSNILKQAQAMQEQMARVQEQAATKTVSGTAGGGIVTVTVNGAMDLLSVKIDPEVVKAATITWPSETLLCTRPSTWWRSTSCALTRVCRSTNRRRLPIIW